MSRKPIFTAHLTEEQQGHVIDALYFLRAKFDNWSPVAKLLRFEPKSLGDVRAKRRSVSPNLTFRIARVVGVGVDDLLAGKFTQPGTCPRCGYRDEREKEA